MEIFLCTCVKQTKKWLFKIKSTIYYKRTTEIIHWKKDKIPLYPLPAEYPQLLIQLCAEEQAVLYPFSPSLKEEGLSCLSFAVTLPALRASYKAEWLALRGWYAKAFTLIPSSCLLSHRLPAFEYWMLHCTTLIWQRMIRHLG